MKSAWNEQKPKPVKKLVQVIVLDNCKRLTNSFPKSHAAECFNLRDISTEGELIYCLITNVAYWNITKGGQGIEHSADNLVVKLWYK